MDAPILGQVALSYAPIIDRQRQVMATRLSIFPLAPGLWLPVAELLSTLGEVWPADGPQVALSVRHENALAELLAVHPSANVMIEVPKFMACDPVHWESIQALAGHGNVLLLSGRPDQPLPKQMLGCFKYSIIDIADERRMHSPGAPPGVKRSIGFWQDGITTMAELEGAFARGAVAVVGWPMGEPPQAQPGRRSLLGPGGRPDLQAVIELINQVDDEAPLAQIESTLKRDPALAFKLMRYINSPIFGLSVEISSFSHAVMMLGYQRLKRWLALLLVTAGNDANQRPLMYAALRRGLLMEALAADLGDAGAKSELFICGVFSLLDRMLQQPFSELLKTIPVPDPVAQALVGGDGPYAGALHLACSTEGGTVHDIRDAAEALMMDMRAVNRALLHAQAGALQLA